jgi:hypothetical protein
MPRAELACKQGSLHLQRYLLIRMGALAFLLTGTNALPQLDGSYTTREPEDYSRVPMGIIHHAIPALD